MASRTLPNLGLKAFFDLGEDGWDDEMSLNLLLLSVLVQGGVISTVSATPGSPTNGDVHLFAADHPTEPNKIAIRDAGAWVYVTPLEGWRVYDRGANALKLFDGSLWSVFSGGSGASYAATETISGTAANLDADQAGKYLRFTNAAAKTLTVLPNATEALPTDSEYHIRNVGAGDLTLVEDTGVTINPPNGGTLVIPQGGTATLKRVATDEFDLLGQTVAV